MPGTSSSSISSLETHMTLGSPKPYSATSSDAGVVVENKGICLSSLLPLFDRLGCEKYENRYNHREYVSREAKVLY